MKKILLIADVKNWAFDNIAQYLKTILSKDYQIEIIYTNDYKNLDDLLEVISNLGKLHYIHFFYREFLNHLLEYIAVSNISSKKITVLLETPMSTSVPDHLFIQSDKDIENHKNAFLFVDTYYTTSSILLNIYKNISSYPKPWFEPIFDNIIVKNIEPNFDNNEIITIAWVGNSKWGEWHFDKESDPKGYYTVLEPAIKELKKQINIKTLIANSAEKKRSRSEVFDILKKSDILLITAHTDGTPLPLIEAMSCGCAIITTNNGIASDVLPEIQKSFIIDKNPIEFIDAVKKLDQDRDLLQEIKRQNYSSFENIFLNEELFRTKWKNLIEGTVESFIKNHGKERKQKLLETIKKRNSKKLIKRIAVKLIYNKTIRKIAKILLYPFLGLIRKIKG